MRSIVYVRAGPKGCEIIADSREEAESKAADIRDNGVWEARNGVRWLMIHRAEIDSVTVHNSIKPANRPKSLRRKRT